MAARSTFTVRRVREQDWAKARDLRLEMLRDTPIAYLETYAAAARRTEAAWRSDVRRDQEGTRSARFIAEAPDGSWVGTVGCFVDVPGRAHVVSVYVAPAWRGRARGVTDRLLEHAQRWAAEQAGATRLLLHVHEDNARARAYYRRAGFVETGATVPYELDPSRAEIEMAKQL